MPYRFLEDIAIADSAFEARGDSIEEMFVSAAEAILNVMVSDLSAIRPSDVRRFRVEDAQIDMLLFQLLQELIYYKDAEQLLLRVRSIQIGQDDKGWSAFVEAAGEPIDRNRHDCIVDVKAVTLQNFSVRQTGKTWAATVTVDV